MAQKKSATEKKIDAAVRLLERHGYGITPPAEPVTIDVTEINKKKLEERKAAFIETLKPYRSIYSADLLNSFYLYWVEPNKSYTKMRWEYQRTWSVGLRLRTWYKNNIKRNNGRQQITDEDRAEKLSDILTGEC